jgi:alkylhydroperoxidase/carboxymuconolactone decarboxylase family protein YurZ
MSLLSKSNKIKVQVLESDKTRFEHMLTQFEYLMSDIEASPLELLENNKDYSCHITVARNSQFALVIEVLAVNGFQILSNDNNIKEIIKKVNNKYTEELAYYSSTVEFKKDVNKKHDSLDKLVDEGNYSELIKISKDITYAPETIMKAKANISRAVTNAIIKNLENVSSYKSSIDVAVKELLNLASDNQLHYHNCTDLMLQAANVAFELCTKNSDAIKTLVKISNQKHLDSIINLKAAAKFGEIALSDEKKYDSHIKIAVKELNIRWLTNLIEPFRDKLSEEENDAINRLIDRIRECFK